MFYIECIKLSWLLNNYVLTPDKQSECTQHLLVDSHYSHIQLTSTEILCGYGKCNVR